VSKQNGKSATPVNLRHRAWGWLTRHQASVAGKSEAQVIALQSRAVPVNAVTNWLLGAVPAGVEVTDRRVPGPAGEIPVRVYRPADADAGTGTGTGTHVGESAGRPLVVYFHGGGYVFGSLNLGNWIAGTVAARVGAVVVSVDYRLAPVHRFPAAVEDCYAALVWAADNAAELGAAGPVAVMGESAGGSLAAVACLIARDRGGPVLRHQALIYPAADMTESGGSKAAADPNALFLSAAEMEAYKRLYLGPDGDPANPWASPLLAADHAGLPPALIQVGEHDPLREDGQRYAAALRAAGVPVRLTEYVGVPHGFVNFPGLSRAAHQAMAEVCAEQSAALYPVRK
jgi:acetyl esterase/lipase